MNPRLNIAIAVTLLAAIFFSCKTDKSEKVKGKNKVESKIPKK